MIYLGGCYARTNDFQNAINIFNKADKISPLEPGELRTLALSYMRTEDTVNALSTFDRILLTSPKFVCDLAVSIARIYNAQKKYEDIIRVLTISTNNCPTDTNTPYNYYLIGTSHFELKNIDAAIEALQKAIAIDSNYFFAYIYLGDIYIHQKNISEGEKLFDYVINNARNNPARYTNELNMVFQKLAGNRLEAKR
jgi:tetratricopeptide (TPR) repeat protein